MFRQLRASLVMLLGFTLLTGIVYPAVVTILAQLMCPYEANGSVVERDGKSVGSSLIGQSFTEPKYFWPRASATTPAYNAAAGSGSNLAPSNPALAEAVKARVAALKAADPDNKQSVPVDLVTASASGLDPHISPEAAAYQVPRVARVRGMKEEAVRELVLQYTEGRDLGLLGEPRVNVLLLNLALDGKLPPAGPRLLRWSGTGR